MAKREVWGANTYADNAIRELRASNWVTRAVEERRSAIARRMQPIWERMARSWHRPEVK